jgi:hypothetical protein
LSPSTVKKISRETILRLGSIYWHSIAGQTVFPVRLAHKLKIPLIIWGAHQGLDQVGMFSHYDYVEMSRKYRHEHDLMGLEAEELIDGYENITESDIEQLRYPEDEEIASVGIRGIYLNNYLFWDARTQHEKMIKMYGYESMTQTRTFDIYSYASCWNYSDLHDYIKLLKCGYGRVVDDATRELRLGRMNKMDAMRQVEKYLFKLPLNKSMYFDWLGVTESAFDYLFDQFRNVIYWRQEENLEWRYVGPFEENNYMLETQTESTFRDFSPTPKGLSTDLENKYIIIGKGVS